MICKNCGNELPQGAKFCVKCGTRVAAERRCINCNTLLQPGDIFCMECGTRNDGGTDSEMKSQKAASAIKTELCENTIKGKMAIIDDNLYFINEKLDSFPFSVSLNYGEKAREIICKRDLCNLFRTDESGIIQFQIIRLYAWNGKLYFSAEVFFDKEKMIEYDYMNGIFSFCPRTNKLELIKSVSVDTNKRIQPFFGGNYAFYLDYMDKEEGNRWLKELESKFGNLNGLNNWREDIYKNSHVLVTLEIATSKETRAFMPMVALKYENGGKEIAARWNNPVFHNGYIYVSIEASKACSLRFPFNNTQSYEFLPPETIIYNDYTYGIFLFAAFNDVIILRHSRKGLTAISQSTLRPVDNFQKYEFGWDVYENWQVYGGNYLVCGFNEAKLIDIKNAEYLGNTDLRYNIDNYDSVIVDNICYKNLTYAVGRRKNHGIGIYCIPWDKMFKKDTNIHDFFQPLF